MKDYTGSRFERWTVVSVVSVGRSGSKWLCRCDCGQERVRYVASLVRGLSQSCGCLLIEVARARRLKHGKTGTPAHTSWCAMIYRCTATEGHHWHYYGARGITVCERWREFENFLADMGERPEGTTLDRINNNGNYEPGNCRWATPKQQIANRRPLAKRQSCASG